MATLRQPQIDAARDLVDATIAAFRTERGVHAETAIAGAARMAGTFLFRSFGFALADVRPGQPVLSEEANEQGPRLVGVLSEILARLGVDLDPARIGGAPGPDNQPQLGFLDTQRRLEPAFAEARDRHGLSTPEAAEAAAVAAAFFVQQCAQVLDPHVGFGLAVYGFVEGAKTAPDPVAA